MFLAHGIWEGVRGDVCERILDRVFRLRSCERRPRNVVVSGP